MRPFVDLSIVVPTFNSAEWLPSTLGSIERALSGTSFSVEVIVVDDGSTDETQIVLNSFVLGSKMQLRVLSGANQGVFLARRKGALDAQAAQVLFIDSRVIVDEEAFLRLEAEVALEKSISTRVGHVETENSVPLVGRFWEVPTYVFWGSYLRNPQVTKITPENFDSVPKGTGFLYVERQSFLDACRSISVGADRFVSDDTKLLRFLAEKKPLLIDPYFRATYRPRTTVRKFLAHGYLRGTLFVDSYYGTALIRTLALWVVASSVPVAAVILVSSSILGWWILPLLLLGVFLLVVANMVVAAKANHSPWRAVASFLVYIVPFAAVFWAGVTRGLWFRMRTSGE